MRNSSLIQIYFIFLVKYYSILFMFLCQVLALKSNVKLPSLVQALSRLHRWWQWQL